MPWPATPLASRESARVRVRVGHGEQWSDWSEQATAEAGLLAAGDWSAAFVSPANIGGIDMPAPCSPGRSRCPEPS